MVCRGASAEGPACGLTWSSIRLSYRPVRCNRAARADIENLSAAHAVLSTMADRGLMALQDRDYRAFIHALHRRLAQAGSKAVLIGGLGPHIYIAALVLLALVATAMAGLLVRALATGGIGGALFLVGFAMLFAWQVGGFIRRNRPRSYRFDDLPKALLP